MHTACGLDCYDACSIIIEEDSFKLKGDASHPVGNGALCALLNKYMFETPRIEKPRVDGVEVSMDEALEAVAKAFKVDRSLLWRGSGNFGVMQEITNVKKRANTMLQQAMKQFLMLKALVKREMMSLSSLRIMIMTLSISNVLGNIVKQVKIKKKR